MEYIVFAVLGLLSGLGFYYLACYQIKVRSEYDTEKKGENIKKPIFKVLFMLIPAILFCVIAIMNMDYWQGLRCMIVILLAMNIAAVDMIIRRIPNSLLLSMLVLHIINIVITTYGTGKTFDVMFSNLYIMILAYIVFVIPGIFRLRVGAGDIKYSAVIGFMLGLVGYLQTMIVMAAGILIYYVYLRITHKGNLKTSAPMGPFLSGGVMVTLLFPLI